MKKQPTLIPFFEKMQFPHITLELPVGTADQPLEWAVVELKICSEYLEDLMHFGDGEVLDEYRARNALKELRAYLSTYDYILVKEWMDAVIENRSLE